MEDLAGYVAGKAGNLSCALSNYSWRGSTFDLARIILLPQSCSARAVNNHNTLMDIIQPASLAFRLSNKITFPIVFRNQLKTTCCAERCAARWEKQMFIR